MLLAPRYQGLDLPIHGPETEVISKGELKAPEFDAKQLQTPSFIRQIVAVVYGTEITLVDLLKKTDEELEIAAEYAGATVVGHQWGLAPAKKGFEHVGFTDKTIKGVPEGHHLVAEVDTILPSGYLITSFKLLSERRQLKQGINEYNELAGTRLNDINSDQFVYGTPAAASKQDNDMWLLDIEPRLRNIS